MGKKLSDGLLAVLGYHRDHPKEFGHARHLIGHYKEIQSLEDLDKIYLLLEERQQLEPSPREVAVYQDKNTGQTIGRTKFRYKSA
jgi:hypothetical protein